MCVCIPDACFVSQAVSSGAISVQLSPNGLRVERGAIRFFAPGGGSVVGGRLDRRLAFRRFPRLTGELPVVPGVHGLPCLSRVSGDRSLCW